MIRYCIDTSSLIQAGTVHYPIDLFPGVWAALEHLAATKRLVSSEMVLDELKRKSDVVTTWGANHQEMFIEVDEIQSREVQSIISQYSRLIDARKNRNQADPFVIALAKLRGMVCVTEEEFGSETRVRIPYVCGQLAVECINLVELMRREKLCLSLSADCQASS